MILAGAATLLAGCSLLLGDSDFSGGTDGSTLVDGGADGKADDGGVDGTGAGGPFCARQPNHYLCADFDQGSFAAGWTKTESRSDAQALGTLALDPNAVSPPASLLSSVAPDPTSARSARLSRTIAGVPRSVHVELDVNPCAMTFTTSTGYLELVKVEHNTATVTGDGITVSIDALGPQLGVETHRDGSSTGDGTHFAGIPAGVWTHVVLDVQLSTTSGRAEVRAGQGPPTVIEGIPTINENVTEMSFKIGVWLDKGMSACESRFDNVVLDLVQ